MYGVDLILGAGIYVIIGDVAAIAGNAMWASFIISAVIALFIALSYAALPQQLQLQLQSGYITNISTIHKVLN